MAASVLCRRAAVLSLRGVYSPQTASATPLCGSLVQVACYNPKPLWRNVREPYIPDKDDERTPEWQKSSQYDRKLFGRFGSASGIDPASLWPSHGDLEKIIAEENQWHPSLDVMLTNIAAKDEEETKKRLDKEKLIAENMAKMPKMVADWRREKRETKLKLKEEKSRRARLLAEAKERFGHAVDPRSAKFLEMVAEIEKEEKKNRKLLKRRAKEEKLAAPATPAAASS
ncbi:large ribosomal subunit protein mL64 [Cololabis saira]|uniref:large ribosomal subunit protein mL64 n=1 Tax=Cololabis saira TaxID=129043 RepID=UPI002AD592B1|nr:large ribosomal subunit protein mL64 [Cololabis saira]